MNKEILKTLEACKPGDLVCVDWFDASTGKTSMNGGSIEVPVKSWGIFLAVVFAKRKPHILLAQNSFKLSDNLFDCDYTVIPSDFAHEVTVVAQGYLPKEVVDDLMRCFLKVDGGKKSTGGLRSPRMFMHRMQRLSCHGGFC